MGNVCVTYFKVMYGLIKRRARSKNEVVYLQLIVNSQGGVTVEI